MFSKITKVLLATSLLACSFSSTSFAQDDLKEKMSKAAEATKEDLVSALNQYLEIRIQNPDNPAVLFSLGRTYQRLYQCEVAQNNYIDVMTIVDEKHPIYQRCIDAYAEVDGCQNWEQVYFDCEIPLGGYASIDDNRIKSCWDRTYYLKPGEHTFKIVDAEGNELTEVYTAKEYAEGEEMGEPHHITLKFERYKEVEKLVEVEHNYVLKERFHPALYWGLIAGGAALVAGSGFFSAMANNAQIKEREYADAFAIGVLGDDKKAQEQHDKVKLGNILTYTFAGIGGAAIISGITLAIISAVSDKERVDDSTIDAYVAPNEDGISVGMGFKF